MYLAWRIQVGLTSQNDKFGLANRIECKCRNVIRWQQVGIHKYTTNRDLPKATHRGTQPTRLGWETPFAMLIRGTTLFVLIWETSLFISIRETSHLYLGDPDGHFDVR